MGEPQKPAVDVEQIFASFSTLFEDFFSGAMRNGNVNVDVKLTDGEAATGVDREVTFTRPQPCTDCSGRGTTQPSTTRTPCEDCDETGKRQMQQGMFLVAAACGACHGRGFLFDHPCASCSGAGKRPVQQTHVVTVPAGASHGDTLRIVGAGWPREGGGRGDLCVYLLVGDRPDPRAEMADMADIANRFMPPPQLPPAIVRSGKSAWCRAGTRAATGPTRGQLLGLALWLLLALGLIALVVRP